MLGNGIFIFSFTYLLSLILARAYHYLIVLMRIHLVPDSFLFSYCLFFYIDRRSLN